MALTEPTVTWQNFWRGRFAMMSVASRPLLSGQDLDRAIDRARAELAALLQGPEMRGSELRVPEMRGLQVRGLDLRGSGNGGEAGGPQAVAQARALLGALLDRRVTERAAQLDGQDARAVASARADRRKATREPSAVTVTARGSPDRKPLVRAASSG